LYLYNTICHLNVYSNKYMVFKPNKGDSSFVLVLGDIQLDYKWLVVVMGLYYVRGMGVGWDGYFAWYIII
jgi:hypothetical protein